MAAHSTSDAFTPDPETRDLETRGHDRRVVGGVAALIAATVLLGALVPAPTPHRMAGAPAEDAACAEWGDGCRVCQRVDDGVACSLPGIACVPKDQSCLRRVGG